MNKLDEYLLENVKYELTDSKYNFHVNPSEQTEIINFGIEFFYANVEQFFDEEDFEKFSVTDEKYISLPVKATIYFSEESLSEDDINEMLLCESEFIGNLIFLNKESRKVSKEEFNDFIIKYKHKLSSQIWISIRNIFNLYVEGKQFPPIPMVLE